MDNEFEFIRQELLDARAAWSGMTAEQGYSDVELTIAVQEVARITVELTARGMLEQA
jgi:hypothetical protein